VLLKRTLTVSIFLAFCTVVLSVSHSPVGAILFLVAASLLVAAGLREFYLLSAKKGRVSLPYGLFAGIAYCALVFFTSHNHLFSRPLPMFAIPLGVSILLFLFFAWRVLRGDYEAALFDFGTLTAGFVFVAWLFSFVIRINYFPPAGHEGRWWVLSLILIVGGADSFALLVGKRFGKVKLSPRVSPNKTVEGFVGGTIGGVALGVICKFLFGLRINLGQSLLLATALCLIGHFGDLAESLLKRDADIKDSGRLPGVGGLLDLMDGILFAAPLTYFFMYLWLD
jgi:phosphatidate cytidylyltransferase